MQRGRYPSDLTEKQCRRIEPLLPAPKSGGRPAKHDRLAILNAILYLVRTGCAWRLLPHDLPHWKTVYHYFRCWRLDGNRLKMEIVKRTDDVRGFKVLPRRWVVERTFGWLGRQRRLSKDYEYLPATSETIIYITMIGLMIRRLVQE